MTNLKQNWFMNENFEMFNEIFGCEYYFDKMSEAIYTIDVDSCNHVIITQYTKISEEYEYLYKKYLEWKKPTFTFNVNTQFCIKAENEADAFEILQEKLDSINAESYREIYINE